MSDQLASVRAKIERAKKHIFELDFALRCFNSTKPYEVRAKREPVNQKVVYYVARADAVPDDVRLIAGESIHNLRSALDHIVMQLWISANGRQPTEKEARQIYFPIFADAEKYKSGSQRKVQGLRQNAIDSINAIEPYKGGKGDSLWTLNELDNIDKHRLLIAAGSAYKSFDLGTLISQDARRRSPEFADFPIMSAFFKPADRLCPLKVGDELFVINPPDAEFQENVEFRFEVSLHEIGVAEDKPILPFVHQMVDLVNNVTGTLSPLV